MLSVAFCEKSPEAIEFYTQIQVYAALAHPDEKLHHDAMHPLYLKADHLTHGIIGAAIEAHRKFGPGLIESIYEWSLMCELELRNYATESQRVLVITYKGFTREEPLRFDILIEGCLLIEGKSVAAILPIHQAQLLSYMKLLDVPIGLLINFNVIKLTDGIHRLILKDANR